MESVLGNTAICFRDTPDFYYGFILSRQYLKQRVSCLFSFLKQSDSILPVSNQSDEFDNYISYISYMSFQNQSDILMVLDSVFVCVCVDFSGRFGFG